MALSPPSFDDHLRVTKRAKTDGASSPDDAAQSKAQATNLDHFFDVLPLDIILEVFAWLFPWDLLNLVATNKMLRSLLMRKSATGVWRAARQNVDVDFVIPKCPTDRSEPDWTRFLFTDECTGCGTFEWSCVEWTRRLRLCEDCCYADYTKKEVHTFTEEGTGDIEHDDERAKLVWDLIPYFNHEADYGYEDETYLRDEAETTFLEIRSYQKKIELQVAGAKEQFDEYVARKLAEKAAIMEPYLKDWNNDVLEIIPNLIRKRQLLITERLVAMGYEKRHVRFNQWRDTEEFSYFLHMDEASWAKIIAIMLPRAEMAKEDELKAEEAHRKWEEEAPQREAARLQREVEALRQKQERQRLAAEKTQQAKELREQKRQREVESRMMAEEQRRRKGQTVEQAAAEAERQRRMKVEAFKRRLESEGQSLTSSLDEEERYLRCKICSRSKLFAWKGIHSHVKALHKIDKITPANFGDIVT